LCELEVFLRTAVKYRNDRSTTLAAVITANLDRFPSSIGRPLKPSSITVAGDPSPALGENVIPFQNGTQQDFSREFP
jgi:hypothetical protein